MSKEYIDKKGIIETLKDIAPEYYHSLIEKAIMEYPASDVAEIRYGKWNPTNIPSYFGGVIHRCSLCDAIDGEYTSILGKYCWKCGATMYKQKGTSNDE